MRHFRPRHACTAVALAAVLLLPGVAAAAGHVSSSPSGSSWTWPWHRHGPTLRHRHHNVLLLFLPRRKITGTLAGLNGTAAPAEIVVQSSHGVSITVMVSAATSLMRRYNGKSSLDEFSVGDHLAVWGHFARGSKTTFNAQRIKDLSLQHAFTRVIGQVQSLASGVATLTVTRRGHLLAPYRRGETVQVTLTASTIVMSAGVTMTVADVQPTMHILVLGLYNRHTRTLRADRVRILGRHLHWRLVFVPAEAAATPTPVATTAPTDTPAPTDTAVPTDTATAAPTDTATMVVTATATTVPAATATSTITATAVATGTVTSATTP